MSKPSKQSLHSQAHPNTLDNYFKNNDLKNKPFAKSTQPDFKDNSFANDNTNCSYNPCEKVQEYSEEEGEMDSNAINFKQLNNLKNAKFEVGHFIDESSNSHTRLAPNPTKIKLTEHDDSPTKNFKQEMHAALKQ
jgi:hypothetical protein